ncbi:MAG: PAS domain-containing protein [Pseudomonadota bacterium]|nr:PAS domain-containing protein [Pseudomonadota bacterium]
MPRARTGDKEAAKVEELLATPDLANVLDSRPYRRFLDKIPIAVAVAEINSAERIVYANPDFERLTRLSAAGIHGQPWTAIQDAGANGGPSLGAIWLR